MNIINLTPHEVVLDNGFIHISFPPSGNVARIDQMLEKVNLDYDVLDGIKIKLPVQATPKVRILNLPKEEPDTYYIVSSYVAQVVKRKDLLAPLSDSSANRDENGRVVSVKMFQQYVEQEIMED